MKALALLCLVACSASQRHTTLAITTATLDAAEVGVVAYDETRQSAITGSCMSVVDCTAKLADYRAKRAAIWAQLTLAYNAVRDAWQLDSDASVATAVQAAAAIEKAVEAFR